MKIKKIIIENKNIINNRKKIIEKKKISLVTWKKILRKITKNFISQK